MVLELTIIPLGRGCSITGDIADLVKIIEASGLARVPDDRIWHID